MTNTRLTDPEILERRYPVRVREFSIRRGSGGDGRQRGGDGVVRRLEFLGPLTLSLLTQRRGPHPPYGAAGGCDGVMGVNRLVRADGSEVRLSGIAQLEVAAGDTLVVETPGGGGFGRTNIMPDHSGPDCALDRPGRHGDSLRRDGQAKWDCDDTAGIEVG